MIKITENEFADFTITIDDQKPFIISFDQALRLQKLMNDRIATERSGKARQAQTLWRRIKASRYEFKKDIVQNTFTDGDFFIPMGGGSKQKMYTIPAWIGYLPKSDQARAQEYFKTLIENGEYKRMGQKPGV